METKQIDAHTNRLINAQPRLHQRAPEIQPYGTVNHGPLSSVRLSVTKPASPLSRHQDRWHWRT